MRANLPQLAATALLTSRGAAQHLPHFEVDVIFPRNETYLPAEIFPVALAIQNLTAVRTLGEYKVQWNIMPYSDGVTPGGIGYDGGELELLEDGGDGASIFVANTNVTGWIGEKDRGARFAMQWHVGWRDIPDDCGYDDTSVSGQLMFGVTAERDAKDRTQDANGTEPDVKKAPECPAPVSVASIWPRADDTECPMVLDELFRQDQPCKVKVDEGLASRIEERAESMLASEAARTAPPPEPTYEVDDDDEDAAPGSSPPLMTVVASAGLVGFLAFAL